MLENLTEQLTQISINTIEKLTFAFAMPDEDVKDKGFYDFQTVQVGFEGWFSGFLVMKMSKHIIPELTRNMLGLDDQEDVSAEENDDMLKEMLNIICGNLLPEIGGNQALFNIDTPEIIDAATLNSNKDEFKLKIDTVLAIDDGQCQLSLLIKEDMKNISI